MAKSKHKADDGAKPSSDRQSKSRPGNLYNEIEYVKVGPEKRVFGIHEGLLCHRSSYFKAALRGDFREAKEGVTLAEDDPKIFQIFNLWLNSGSFFSKEQLEADADDQAELFSKACLFADKRGIPAFYNAIIDALIDRHIEADEVRWPPRCTNRFGKKLRKYLALDGSVSTS